MKMLQTLMALFQDSQKVDRLLRISDKQEFFKIMNAIGIK
ncbi:PTS sugar transporter subunit IIA [Latilactobacillus curvatus]|nr:PTS sugar transporter subunit IIA [Latilactobacillus curvatus]